MVSYTPTILNYISNLKYKFSKIVHGCYCILFFVEHLFLVEKQIEIIVAVLMVNMWVCLKTAKQYIKLTRTELLILMNISDHSD